MPGHPYFLKESLDNSQSWVVGALSLVGGRDERIVLMLEHMHFQTFYEVMCGCTDIAEHDVSVPPFHNHNCICVDSIYY